MEPARLPGVQMSRRNWKRVRPTSLRQAMQLCLDHARERHNRSVERVADLMGQPSHWIIYKWIESGRLPAVLIRPFEHACGATFVTDYLATSAHKLLVDIPCGRPARDTDVLALQTQFNEAVNLLARFYRGEAEADATLAALTAAMGEIAGHRANVAQSLAPELALFEEGEA